MKPLIFPNLKSADTIVVDTETDGLDWKKNKVVGYVLTWGREPDETVYYPVRHQPGGNYEVAPVEKFVKSLMEDPTKRKVGHYLKFDMHMMANHGIVIKGPISCTMVNMGLIDENAGQYSLEASAKSMGVQPKLGDKLYRKIYERFKGDGCKEGRNSMQFFWRMPGDDPDVVDYSVGDGTSTWQLYHAQLHRIKEEELERVWDVECRGIRTLWRMERKGVFVDEERLSDLSKFNDHKIEQFKKVYGSEHGPRSPKLAGQVMAKYKSEFQLTKLGAPSFVEKWLRNYPEGRDLIQFRRAENLRDSFINPLVNEHLFKGRVHTTFNQLKMDDYGVVTGRLSSSDPNMQQVPKRDKELAPMFRSVFRPDRGFVWSSNDYNQQEYRVFAEYTGDKALIDGYNSDPPLDIHQVIADICGVERDPRGKRINFGKLYGMGLQKLASELGMTMAEVRIIDQKYRAAVPEAAKFLKDVERVARVRGFVRSKLGRRRRLDHHIAHKGGNAVIQMSSADITKLKMVEIDEYFNKTGDVAQMLLQVHDELSWQYPIDSKMSSGLTINDMAQRMMQSFGEDDLIHIKRLKMAIDSFQGDDWAEATFKFKFKGFGGNSGNQREPISKRASGERPSARRADGARDIGLPKRAARPDGKTARIP